MRVQVQSFFHQATSTFTHIVADTGSGVAALIDPVLDFDQPSGRITTVSADKLMARVAELKYTVEWILETHAHADHLSAGSYLRDRLDAKLGIGTGIIDVQKTFSRIFNLGDEFSPNGSQFDRLFSDNDSISLGSLQGTVMHTPGHTGDSVTYLFGDAAFVGDTMVRPDFGTARCDFPGGSARQLYRTIQRLYSLPETTRMFLCHDYPKPGQEPCFVTTVAAQKEGNIHVTRDTGEDVFVAMRESRDAALGMPALILPALQINIRAGQLPPPDDNGVSYLRLPLNQF